jgi:hypothetical protein
MKRRIIYKDNTTLNDFTNNLYDYYANTESFTTVALEDNLFIGATLPFNHFYIDATGTNAQTSEMSVSYWDGTEFQSAVELTDGTSSNGVTLTQSGFVEFVTDKNKNWAKEDTVNTSGTELIDGLGNKTIYDLYWLKIAFSADLDAVTLNWLGSVYSNDNDLKLEFPDLDRYEVRELFEYWKNDYFEQHCIAAQMIDKELINRNIMSNENQVLTREDLKLASVQKVAALIYNAMGDDYVDNFIAAEKEYLNRIEKAYVKIDTNANARVDVQERTPFIGMLYR